MVRLTDRPDMTLDVYRGRKTTMQQNPSLTCFEPGIIKGSEGEGWALSVKCYAQHTVMFENICVSYLPSFNESMLVNNFIFF